jgi:transcription elongation factor Elf1
MGMKRLDQINHYLKAGYNLRATCLACGHVTVLDALSVSMRCKSAKDRAIATIEQRLKCAQCGARNASCGPVER